MEKQLQTIKLESKTFRLTLVGYSEALSARLLSRIMYVANCLAQNTEDATKRHKKNGGEVTLSTKGTGPQVFVEEGDSAVVGEALYDTYNLSMMNVLPNTHKVMQEAVQHIVSNVSQPVHPVDFLYSYNKETDALYHSFFLTPDAPE